MKPFNLEQALAGKPVVTRDGKEVTQIVKWDIQVGYPVSYVTSGCKEVLFTTTDGYYKWDKSESRNDLFMDPEVKEAWVNVYKWSMGTVTVGEVYSSEEEAYSKRDNVESYLKTICIHTWEE